MLNAISNVILNGFIIHFYTIICILTVCLLYDTLMMVTLVAEICMIKSLNVKCDIKYHTEWLYHKFLYNYLYTNCMLVIRHPDDGHTCGRNMFVRIICDRTHV